MQWWLYATTDIVMQQLVVDEVMSPSVYADQPLRHLGFSCFSPPLQLEASLQPLLSFRTPDRS